MDRSSVILWAKDTQRGGDLLVHVVTFVRSRRDYPIDFANRARLVLYLTASGFDAPSDADFSEVWASFTEHRDRQRGSQGTLPTSWAEAARLGRTRFAGTPCTKDPSHGNIRSVSKNRRCVVCRRLDAKDWTKRTRTLRADPYAATVEVEPLSPEETQLMLAALTKTRRVA